MVCFERDDDDDDEGGFFYINRELYFEGYSWLVWRHFLKVAKQKVN